MVVIGDGAKWIGGLANDYFPDAIEIIDLYHAKEHVFELRQTTITNEAELYSQKTKLYKMLENGNIEELMDAFTNCPQLPMNSLKR